MLGERLDGVTVPKSGMRSSQESCDCLTEKEILPQQASLKTQRQAHLLGFPADLSSCDRDETGYMI